MATADPMPGITSPSDRSGSGLLVVLSAMPAEQLEAVLAHLSASFPAQSLSVAGAGEMAPDAFPALNLIPVPAGKAALTLTAADFVTAQQLAEEHDASAILMLGPASGSLGGDAVARLAHAVLSTATDLALPCYDLPPLSGLVNSAILYPLSRALFASGARFPLAIDLGLSRRMAERLAQAGQRFAATSQTEALVWPVSEAVAAGFTISELNVGERALPQPTDPDINAILAHVTGSLFADID